MRLNQSSQVLEVTVQYARKLRKNPTRSERLLWQQLRRHRLKGWRFLRQRPILVNLDGVGTFVVADFYCGAARLVVEVDGSVHEGQRQQDEARDEALRQRGYSVLHIAAEEVEHHLPLVLERIAQEVNARVQGYPPLLTG
jgi:very-short-patch-repair endonuclease